MGPTATLVMVRPGSSRVSAATADGHVPGIAHALLISAAFGAAAGDRRGRISSLDNYHGGSAGSGPAGSVVSASPVVPADQPGQQRPGRAGDLDGGRAAGWGRSARRGRSRGCAAAPPGSPGRRKLGGHSRQARHRERLRPVTWAVSRAEIDVMDLDLRQPAPEREPGRMRIAAHALYLVGPVCPGEACAPPRPARRRRRRGRREARRTSGRRLPRCPVAGARARRTAASRRRYAPRSAGCGGYRRSGRYG